MQQRDFSAWLQNLWASTSTELLRRLIDLSLKNAVCILLAVVVCSLHLVSAHPLQMAVQLASLLTILTVAAQALQLFSLLLPLWFSSERKVMQSLSCIPIILRYFFNMFFCFIRLDTKVELLISINAKLETWKTWPKITQIIVISRKYTLKFMAS